MSEEIEIDVVLKLDKSEVDKASQISSEDKEVSNDITKNVIEDISGDDAKLAKLLDTDTTKVREFQNFLQNPSGAISGKLAGLGKAIPIIGVVIAVVIPIVIEAFKRQFDRGGIFDRTLQIKTTDALNAFFNRLDQKNLALGKRGVIFTSNKGFTSSGGLLTGSSLQIVGTGRSAVDIGETVRPGDKNFRMLEQVFRTITLQNVSFKNTGGIQRHSSIQDKAEGLN